MFRNLLCSLIRATLQGLLWLRYRVKLVGLDSLKGIDPKGVLFLPNHPGLIDPVIVASALWSRFQPRALVIEKQIKGSPLRHVTKLLRILPISDTGVLGMSGHDTVLGQLDKCVEALKAGDNVLMYPAGRIYRSKLEQLRGNGGLSRIMKELPDVKIVLVRTTGLWGSEFTRAKGYQLSFGACVMRHLHHVLLGGIFFMPRREVTVEFVPKPADFPDGQDKETLNRYLEKFYNATAHGNTYVPYTWFEGGGTRTIPEPDSYNAITSTAMVPKEVREAIMAHLHELTDKKVIRESDTLGSELGLDSLAVAELLFWVQNQFGHEAQNPEGVQTVANLMLAAIGESASTEPLKPVPPNWFYDDDSTLEVTKASSVPMSFLLNAKKHPSRPVWADQNTGVLTNRKMVLAIMVLKDVIAKLPGDRVGILMPATAASTVFYLACQFAGKVPVMINWTVGNRNMLHCIKASGVQKILTAELVIQRLKGTGVDFTGVEEYFATIDELKKGISLWKKLWCVAMSHISWHSLWKAPIPETAVILFTSGSESMPKTVPLTHKNMLTGLDAAIRDMQIKQGDVLLGMLPPFHSFGILLNTIFTCATNIRVVYHANPVEGAMLARMTAAYKVTFYCGTPTFVTNIVRNATPEQLSTLTLVVTGAEKCQQHTIDLLRERAPKARIFEGYGITECSPIVSLNKPNAIREGTIGRLLDCEEGIVMDEDCTRELPPDTVGMLVVRGPNIFNGYLNYDGPSPFVEYKGKTWYRTGDLVKLSADGYVTFAGRLKRFVKIGGEMISLPAIEEVLLATFPGDPEIKGPALAVEDTGTEDQPVLTLFTTVPLEREAVNAALKEKGFSPIQFIRTIVKLDAIPVLGTGKTDYRTLKTIKPEA